MFMSNTPIKFATKRGFLTKYAHACGYVDTAKVGNDKDAITLCLDGVYNVRCHVGKPNKVWDCFDNTAQGRRDAQKRFCELVREHKAQRKINPMYSDSPRNEV